MTIGQDKATWPRWLLALALAACTGGTQNSNLGATGTAGMNGAPIAMAPGATPPAMAAGSSSASAGNGSSARAAAGSSAAGMPMTAGQSGTSAVAGAGGGAAIAGTGSTADAMAVGAGGSAAAGGAGGSGAAGSPSQALPAVTDYTKDGPFKTMVEPNVGPMSNYTMYRPDPLGANGFLHSPIVFGPGIATSCAPGGLLNVYTTLLTHLASHGYVTICVNSLGGGPNDPANLQAMQMGLEWLIAQNDQPGTYQGKLAVDRAIAMGYSIGATASTQLSSHKAIMTTVSIHGHNTMGDPHGPIWLMTGTMDVIDDNRTTLGTLGEAPAILTALPIGHLDVPTEISTGGRYIAPITAWLRYFVNGDEGAKHFLLGADCDVCKSPWITPESNDKWKALK